jgi:hypothetical protein
MFDALKTCFHLFFSNSIFRGFRLYATFERSIGPAAARQISIFAHDFSHGASIFDDI